MEVYIKQMCLALVIAVRAVA